MTPEPEALVVQPGAARRRPVPANGHEYEPLLDLAEPGETVIADKSLSNEPPPTTPANPSSWSFPAVGGGSGNLCSCRVTWWCDSRRDALPLLWGSLGAQCDRSGEVAVV